MAAEPLPPPDAAVVQELAPSGRLRVAINLGNGVLAQGAPAAPRGVSVDLARELARRLGVEAVLIAYDTAGKVIPAQGKDHWDIAFLAAEPERAVEIAFTAPYVYIDGTYLVAANSRFRTCADLDAEGVRIAVGQGAAYDLALTRQLQHATLVRAPTSAAAIDLFKAGGMADAAGGVRQALVDARTPATRVLPDSFTRIEQAMATPRGRPAGSRYLAAFVEAMKANGFVRAGLDRSGQTGALVAD
jgi:polar amino acid transport system substrate-binding protein